CGAMVRHARCPIAIAEHFLVNIHRSLEPCPADHRKQEEVEQVGDKEHLKRTDVWLAASANILNSQIPRSSQKQAQAPKNLGIPMEKQLARMRQKMDDRKIMGC